MTTVRGQLRSTETHTAEGHGDDPATARAQALEGFDLTAYELTQANTIAAPTPGTVAVRAVIRSRATRDHEASGRDYQDALQNFRNSIPDGYAALHIIAD
jgi:hypothetical protein